MLRMRTVCFSTVKAVSIVSGVSNSSCIDVVIKNQELSYIQTNDFANW